MELIMLKLMKLIRLKIIISFKAFSSNKPKKQEATINGKESVGPVVIMQDIGSKPGGIIDQTAP
jgi:hypothetical protein